MRRQDCLLWKRWSVNIIECAARPPKLSRLIFLNPSNGISRNRPKGNTKITPSALDDILAYGVRGVA